MDKDDMAREKTGNSMQNSLGSNTLAYCTDLMKEWDYDSNDQLGLDPQKLTSGSGIKAYWRCSNCKGLYITQIYNKKAGRGCPYCTGKKVLVGFNDLATAEPDLVKEWHPTKNKPLTPQSITKGSNRKIWWICKLGHEWEDTIPDRRKGYGCPFCSNRKVLIGYNDLETTHPEIAKEWDYVKNSPLTPKDVTYGINRIKPWWRCAKCGFEWQATILSRSRGEGCPACGMEQRKKSRIDTMLKNGENSLLTVRPDLAKEWHPNKNGIKTPDQFTASSSEKIWWKCSVCGYEWEATINHRAKGRGCKECNEKSTSFSEQAVYYYMKQVFANAINRDKSLGFEVDIFIPDINTAIEYDGVYFHGKNRRGMIDEQKDELCTEKGVQLIRIRENGLSKTKDSINIVREDESINSLEKCIVKLFERLKVEKYPIPDIRRDRAEINLLFSDTIKKNSVASLYPEVAKRWHPSKNGTLTPEQVSAHSGRYVWWVCENGHEYFQIVANATKGIGCEICGRRKGAQTLRKKGLIVGVNDLKTLYPDLSKEWDYELNTDRPEEYKEGSNYIKYWKCSKCGFRWQAEIYNRTKLGRGCPNCAKEKMQKSHQKRVRCIETGMEFNCLKEAGEWANVTDSNISHCARGKTHTAGGYHWEFVEE